MSPHGCRHGDPSKQGLLIRLQQGRRLLLGPAPSFRERSQRASQITRKDLSTVSAKRCVGFEHDSVGRQRVDRASPALALEHRLVDREKRVSVNGSFHVLAGAEEPVQNCPGNTMVVQCLDCVPRSATTMNADK